MSVANWPSYLTVPTLADCAESHRWRTPSPVQDSERPDGTERIIRALRLFSQTHPVASARIVMMDAANLLAHPRPTPEGDVLAELRTALADLVHAIGGDEPEILAAVDHARRLLASHPGGAE